MFDTEIKERVNSEIRLLNAKQQWIANGKTGSAIACSVANQAHINTLLNIHLNAEKAAGKRIHSAAREKSFSARGKVDDDCKLASVECFYVDADEKVCRQLESPSNSMCSANAKGLLDW